MSGPTGVNGFQGVMGGVGSNGAVGITGPYGIAGPVGLAGTTGATGLSGATGTQLYGNGSLIQTAIGVGPPMTANTRTSFTYESFNPALSGGKSTTISGQYGTGLNYYGSALSFNDSLITIPAGKYYISASMSTKSTFDGVTANLELAPWNGISYDNAIVYSTPAEASGTCHLQHVYSPSQDTVVSLLVYASNLITSGVISSKITLSIVKIW